MHSDESGEYSGCPMIFCELFVEKRVWNEPNATVSYHVARSIVFLSTNGAYFMHNLSEISHNSQISFSFRRTICNDSWVHNISIIRQNQQHIFKFWLISTWSKVDRVHLPIFDDALRSKIIYLSIFSATFFRWSFWRKFNSCGMCRIAKCPMPNLME